MAQKKALGRGLGSIISSGIRRAAAAQPPKRAEAPRQKAQPQPETAVSAKIPAYGSFCEVSIDKIVPSAFQARKDFPEEEIKALADSIASEGLIQPLVVRRAKDGYELVSGERRLRACRRLGLKRVVVCVQSASDASAAVKGLIENLQRADLNPIEQARGIQALMENFRLTQDAVSQRIAKPRSSVANALRLLKLPEEVQGYIAKNNLDAGHAKVLMSVEDPARAVVLARQAIERNLSVRALEELVRRVENPRRGAAKTAGRAISEAAQNAVVRDIQNKLATKLNAAVSIKHGGRRGKIVIEYLGNDDLSRILEIIGVKI